VNIQLFKPAPMLEQHISMIWAFENADDGIAEDDAKLVAPNGCMKLLIPYRKKITSFIGGLSTVHREMSMIVAGQMRQPVQINPEPGGGTIGFEFKPASAALFFGGGMHELTDRVLDGRDLWGSAGERLRERFGNAASTAERVALVQRFLCRFVMERSVNRAVETAVQQIIRSSGLVSVQAISDELAYSRQHLTRLFKQDTGLSPKEFARIARFQQIYAKLNSHSELEGLLDGLEEWLDRYYDQSHFIREFQSFVGFTPGEYKRIRNEFGKIFYRNQEVPFLQ